MLIGFNAAAYARQLESKTDEEVVAEAMGVLRTIYGEGVPGPLDYVITRWGEDPWSLGSYSYNAGGRHAHFVSTKLCGAVEASCVEHVSLGGCWDSDRSVNGELAGQGTVGACFMLANEGVGHT